MPDKHSLALQHLVQLLVEVTAEVPDRASAGDEFHAGQRLAWHEATSLLHETLRVFGIPPASVGADRIDPDRFLR